MDRDLDARKLARSILVGLILVLVLVVLFTLIESFDVLPIFSPVTDILYGYIPLAVISFFIIVAARLVLSLLRPAFTHGLERVVRSEAEVKMLWQLVSYVVWTIVLVIVILLVIGNPVDFIVTFTVLGVVFAALIYVLQKPILNFAGWLTIIFRRPYKIGDRIEVHDIKGYVVEIGVFSTSIREFGGWMHGESFTGRLVSFPNSTIFDYPVANYTKFNRYIWDDIMVSITYESDHDMAKHILKESASQVIGDLMSRTYRKLESRLEMRDLGRHVSKEPEVMMEFAPSSLEMSVIYFCRSEDRREVRSRITELIMKRVKKADSVNVAYPHMHLVGGIETGKK